MKIKLRSLEKQFKLSGMIIQAACLLLLIVVIGYHLGKAFGVFE